MDPNEALDRLRQVFVWWERGYADASDLASAIEMFNDLDEWLSKGGALPEAWNQGLRGSLGQRRSRTW